MVNVLKVTVKSFCIWIDILYEVYVSTLLSVKVGEFLNTERPCYGHHMSEFCKIFFKWTAFLTFLRYD